MLAQKDLAAIGLRKARDAPEQRRLSGTAGTEYRDHLARGHLEWAGLDGLDCFRPQLGDRAGRMEADPENPGEGPQPDGRDKQQRENEGIYPAQSVEEPTHRRVEKPARGDVLCREDAAWPG